MCQRPLTLAACASPLGSVDGYALQIDELKGTKPTEKIDLSSKGLGVASAFIIASCIKENRVLKELRCAAARVFAFVSAPLTRLLSHLSRSAPGSQSRLEQDRRRGRLRARSHPQGDAGHQPGVRRRPSVRFYVRAR